MSIGTEFVSDITSLIRTLRSWAGKPADSAAETAPQPLQGADDTRSDESQSSTAGTPT